MPDASGRIKGISVPKLPPDMQKTWEEARRKGQQSGREADEKRCKK